ncbi:MAG: ketoacyl-ACP synthase III [Rubrivivax sp.]|nr:MAG: ketoacyl-ACP synthase III [Rubrivivax sp.]
MTTERPLSGQQAVTRGARVAGIVSCLPQRKVLNPEFESTLSQQSVADVIKMIGVHARHWVDADTTASDLCLRAGEHLLDKLDWAADSVDALIFLSQTPDYRLPATACVLHGALKMRPGTIAFDVNLGCSGYPYALWLGMMMVQSGAARRVLLAVGDTISKTVDPQDRSTALLFGDAGTMTAIEAGPDEAGASYFILGTDGLGARQLIVPNGAIKRHQASDDERWADKDLACLFMDGGEVFKFTLQAVPALIESCLSLSGRAASEHDAFLFHQANLFMLKHLIKKTKLPAERVPINIDRYGNCSCASIPLLMTTDLADRLRTEPMTLAMFGFGVGFSWAAASLTTQPLNCVETIYL